MGMCLPEKYEIFFLSPKITHVELSPTERLVSCSGHPLDGAKPGPGAMSPPALRGLMLCGGTGVGDIWENLFSNSLPYTSPSR